MNQTGPWSVKGIDQRARDAAREAASAEGLTLGEYLNRLLMADEEEQHNEISSLFRTPRPRPEAASSTLDRLTRRIEAAEARSTLAITGMDHTVLGLVAKLEKAEGNSNAVVGHVESLMDEIGLNRTIRPDRTLKRSDRSSRRSASWRTMSMKRANLPRTKPRPSRAG